MKRNTTELLSTSDREGLLSCLADLSRNGYRIEEVNTPTRSDTIVAAVNRDESRMMTISVDDDGYQFSAIDSLDPYGMDFWRFDTLRQACEELRLRLMAPQRANRLG